MLQKSILLMLLLVSTGIVRDSFCDVSKSGPVMSLSPLTICKALDTASKTFGTTSSSFKPSNDQQEAFLSNTFALYRKHVAENTFQAHELQSFVSSNVAELNKILRERGFSIQLQSFRDVKSLGVVSLQDILVKWKEKARCQSMQSAGQEYASFFLPKKTNGITFFRRNTQDQETVIARIETQTNDIVYCAVRLQDTDKGKVLVPFFQNSETVPTDSVVADAISSLQSTFDKFQRVTNYNGIELPMIHYQNQPSLEWLKKLEVAPEWFIEQALQEVIFKMNEDGARAKAAVALEVEMKAAPPMRVVHREPLVVNKPFLLWIERSGVPAELPLFAAYLHQTYWKIDNAQ